MPTAAVLPSLASSGNAGALPPNAFLTSAAVGFEATPSGADGPTPDPDPPAWVLGPSEPVSEPVPGVPGLRPHPLAVPRTASSVSPAKCVRFIGRVLRLARRTVRARTPARE